MTVGGTGRSKPARTGPPAPEGYVFDGTDFEDLGDAGMHASRSAVVPLAVEPVGDLLEALRGAAVELRLLERLTPLRGVWETSLHASGIRLRNAVGWEA